MTPIYWIRMQYYLPTVLWILHSCTVGNWQDVPLSLPFPRSTCERGCKEHVLPERLQLSKDVRKCIAEIYTEEEWENAEFYIADSCRIPIRSSDTIKIDVDNGPQELEWTLNRYIHLSNAKYPSKVWYYCVRKGWLYCCTWQNLVPLYVTPSILYPVYIDMSKIVCMLEVNLGTYSDTQVFWYVSWPSQCMLR